MNLLTDFLNWYIGLFQSQDNNILLATWGVTLATLGSLATIVYKIINYSKSKLSKVRVIAGLNYQIFDYGFKRTAGNPAFSVTITNLTNRSIYINKPTISTSTKINGENEFSLVEVNDKYPQKLEHGEQARISYDTGDFYPKILSKLDEEDTIKFIVYTTEGKSYKSNKFVVKDILVHMDISSRLYKQNS
jgi:hypothetical protein